MWLDRIVSKKGSINTKITLTALITVTVLMVAGSWALFSYFPTHLAFNAILISAFSIIISLGIVWLVTRRLTQPILYLIDHVDGATGTGTGWTPMDIKTGDEIERLAATFNNMMAEVHTTRQALADEKEFYSGIIQNSAAPMFVIDNKHTIIFWNNSLAKLTGKSSFQMKNTKLQWTPFYAKKRPVLADLVIDRKLKAMDNFYADYEKSLFVDGAFQAEGWFENINGQRRYLFFSAAPIMNNRNEIVAAVETLEDITDRKIIEEKLAQKGVELEAKHVEREQLFYLVEHAKLEWEQTLDHLRDFVILTDAAHRIRRCNKLLAEATGRPVDDLVGADWRELIKEAGFRFVTFNGTSGEINHQLSGRSYDITIYPIEDNEMVTGYVVSINDTTDLRATSQELEKTYSELKDAQLQIYQQEKLASIGQLAAGVAHEINNPMGYISSNLSTLNKYVDRMAEFIAAEDQVVAACADGPGADLVRDLRKKLKIDYITGDARQLISESLDGAGRVRRIVQDLKSFSRVDQVETALVNLNESLETTINIAWNEIKYIAELNREFGDIPQIMCHPQQLNQVFLNLLVNAAHAMGENQGIITVRTWNDGANVFVSVADTGCGIPEDIRQRIFEPFFTTKEVGKGTGLGLSISYDIVRKHGGEITVESEPGSGTTFTVRLPLKT